MLVVVGFFILTFTGGVLSGRKTPPPCDIDEPLCPKNQHYTQNDTTCLKTCANRLVVGKCCKPFTGCVCNDGLVRLYDDATGPCIPEKSCRKKCKDKNAVFKKCPSPCPLTCAEPNPRPCPLYCPKSGCECASGFVLSKTGGKCIKLKDCPVPRCPKNEHYVREDKDCVKTCGNRLLPGVDTAGACAPYTGCVCDTDHVRKYDNGTGPCIPVRSCPRIPKKCGQNEQRTSCRIKCPPQTCESIFTTYDCPEPTCEPGCDCINGYLRDAKGICIPSDKCSKSPIECGPNEVLSDCKIVCPPQSCESLYTTYLCAKGNCTPGCNCIDGYLRNSAGVCIPSEECSKEPCKGDSNATRVPCASKCPLTCAQPDSSRPCPLICVLNACECKPGYIFSKPGGVCIAPSDCPDGSPQCGANRTYVDCYVGCPSEYCPADDSRAVVACSVAYPCPGGCACNPGYLIESRDNPRCILSEECPPVNCTRPNEIWHPNPSSCLLESCEDRGRECDNKKPGPPRCVCQKGYYRNRSDVCVPASECPDLGCNGDLNATFSNCTSDCPARCADLSVEGGGRVCAAVCRPPGCVCKKDYVLNDLGKCIKPEDCTVGCKGDLNATEVKCGTKCPATCAEPEDIKSCVRICVPNACKCNPGYILSTLKGVCIAPNDCPDGSPKCGANQTYVRCKIGCPTNYCPSDDSRAMVACSMPYPCPGGCACNPGYLLESRDNPRCILSEECPPVKCTRPNEVWDRKPPNCFLERCEDRGRKCDNKYPAPPRCVCQKGYYRNANDICVPSSECPDLGCNGDLNATFSNCTSDCPARCADLSVEGGGRVCAAVCRPPGCVCKKDYVLNDLGKCIKPEDCPEVGCNGDPNAVRDDCASACQPTCSKPTPAELCIAMCSENPCVCKTGYILDKKDGKCIERKSCPVEPQCKEDRNETYSTCPSHCQATCDEPDTITPCVDSCKPPGCICKQGYLKTKHGKCISPKDCPGGSPTCGVNQTYVDCKIGCPNNYCPVDDRLAVVVCDPPFPCPGGCVCKEGYLRNNYEKERCILSSECPPVECTRPNEVWESNPPKCLREKCTDIDSDTGCNFYYPNSPRCICKKGYYRNESDICVPASKCNAFERITGN